MARQQRSDEGGARRKVGETPQAISTEVAVLGACLSEGMGWWNQVQRMTAGDPATIFYNSTHRIIARAIQRSIENGTKMAESAIEDQILLLGGESMASDARNLLVKIQASTSITSIAALQESINLLVQKQSARAMLEEIESVRADIVEKDLSPNDISRRLTTISVDNLMATELRTIGDVIDDIDTRKVAPWSISSGMKELDDHLGGGFEPGHNYVLAGRPKMGKTMFCQNITLNAIDDEAVVIFVSMETLEVDFIYKMIAAEGFLPQQDVKNLVYRREDKISQIDPEIIREYKKARKQVSQHDIITLFPQDMTNGYHSIVSAVATVKAKYEGRKILVIVDYLQLLIENQAAAYTELAQYTRDFKMLSMEMDVPIVYISQLSREGADGEMPKVHHLRGSGTIEQDASAVIMLNRESLVDESKPKDRLQVEVALNRNGTTGTFELRFDGATNSIFGLDEEDVWGETESFNTGNGSQKENPFIAQDSDDDPWADV